jgi:hypothetical protein
MKRLQQHLAVLIFFSILGGNLALAQNPLKFHWRNPLPQGHDLYDVVYAKGVFVAVGQGTILTSTNGSDWNSAKNIPIDWFSSVVFGNGQFVACGGTNVVISSDGLSWSNSFQGTAYSYFYNCTWGNGVFVLPTYGYGILTSTNARDWDNVGWISSGPCHFLNGRFLMFSASYHTNLQATSVDGRNWHYQTNNLGGAALEAVSGAFGNNRVTYGNGVYVIVGFGSVFRSTNAVQWVRDLSPDDAAALDTVTFSNGRFLSFSYGRVFTSSNAVDWSFQTIDAIPQTGHEPVISKVIWSGSKYVAVGSGGLIMESSDTEHWNRNTVGSMDNLWSIVHGDGAFVTSSDRGILTSNDGISWTNVTLTNNYDRISHWYFGHRTASYGNGMFVLSSTGGPVGKRVLLSTNGVEWTNAESTLSIERIVYGNGVFVGTRRDGSGSGFEILTSTNGSSWQMTLTLTNVYIYDVAFGNGRFVAAGPGKVWLSETGTGWISKTVSGNGEICYAGGFFWLLYPNARRSTDGIAWSEVPVAFGSNLISYGNGLYVAVHGPSGTLMSSTNGFNWNEIPVNLFGGSFNDVAFVNGKFYLVGNYGAIVESDFVNSPVSIAPSSVFVPATGSSGEISIATRGDWYWLARNTNSWLTLQTTNGMGSAAVTYSVDRISLIRLAQRPS